MLLLACSARAGAPAPNPAEKAKLRELHESIRDGKRRIKQAALDQHQGLRLIREREKSDIHLTKASAAPPETMHQELLVVRERYRYQSRALRQRRLNELQLLREKLKWSRAEVSVLSGKK